MPAGYNLRSTARRAQTQTTTSSGRVPGEYQTPPGQNADASLDKPEESDSDTASIRSASSAVRPGLSYSQVVTARYTSRERQGVVETSGTGKTRPTELDTSSLTNLSSLLDEMKIEDTSDRLTERSDSLDDTRDESAGPWREVRRGRRSRSLDITSSRPAQRGVPSRPTAHLTDTQRQVVRAAEAGLAPAEHARVQERMRVVNVQSPESSETESRGEGPSTMEKGKSVDGRNWGAVGIPAEELDPEAQRRALEAYSIQPAEDDSAGSNGHDVREATRRRKAKTRMHHEEGDSSDVVTSTPAPRAERASSGRKQERRQRHQGPAEQPHDRSRRPRSSHIRGPGHTERQDPATNEASAEDVSSSESERSDRARRRARRGRRDATHGRKSKPSRHEGSAPVESTRHSEALVDDLLAQKRSKAKSSRRRHEGGPDRLAPANQIEPRSTLGHAFRGLNRRDTNPSNSPSESPESSSEPSDSESSADDSDSESSSSESNSSEGSSRSSRARRSRRSRRLRRHSSRSRRRGRGRRRYRRSRSRSRSRPRLKPRDPDAYDGRTDVTVFQRFMQQCTDYVDGYGLEERRQIASLSYFLTDKAYEFYVNTVSRNSRSWTLRKFFVGLFNYCFPIDFRTRTREKLDRFKQSDRTVREYVHQLETMFLTAGVLSKQDKNNTVSSDRPGQAPGLANFNIEVLADAEHLRDRAESTNQYESLGLHSIELGEQSPSEGTYIPLEGLVESPEHMQAILQLPAYVWDYEYPQFPAAGRSQRQYLPMVDLFCKVAGEVLVKHAPYVPPDVFLHLGLDEDSAGFSFVVYPTIGGYAILQHYLAEDPVIPRQMLTQAGFNLPQWYASQVSAGLGLGHWHRRVHGEPMRNLLASGTAHVLEQEIPWPAHTARHNINEPRYECHMDANGLHITDLNV
ncbi:hypothetical protein CERSUDRAFT_91737 [Gelatoporia subvermispora B]|uniref:Retrotransposon gag domain-containing protein n=1 Tax=Ceriporiopsis subvermispora (strain B) TaxID=914234 RepID=M2RQ50_CERS8|nr:hypothetical protein CERSUDRAFT_91737 [Gelatoporia subvermispora B]